MYGFRIDTRLFPKVIINEAAATIVGTTPSRAAAAPPCNNHLYQLRRNRGVLSTISENPIFKKSSSSSSFQPFPAAYKKKQQSSLTCDTRGRSINTNIT
jgi:hypothetical protein